MAKTHVGKTLCDTAGGHTGAVNTTRPQPSHVSAILTRNVVGPESLSIVLSLLSRGADAPHPLPHQCCLDTVQKGHVLILSMSDVGKCVCINCCVCFPGRCGGGQTSVLYECGGGGGGNMSEGP